MYMMQVPYSAVKKDHDKLTAFTFFSQKSNKIAKDRGIADETCVNMSEREWSITVELQKVTSG